MRKSILIISAVFPPEPIVSAKLSEDIANELSLKYKVTVIAPNPTRPFGFKFNVVDNKKYNFELINVDTYTCPESKTLGRLRESYSFGAACVKYIRKNHKKIDAIYMNSWPIFSQYLATLTSRKYSIPLVTHVQDVYPESLSNKMPLLGPLFNLLLKPLDRFILKNSKRVIAISLKMRNNLVKTRKLSLDKTLIVPNWQNENMFLEHDSKKNVLNNKSELFTFMYLGNIGPVAGIDLLIESFNKANLKKCQLVIAGSGSKKQDLEKIVFFKKIERVNFVSVADGKVPEIQELANVMLLPIKKGAASSSIPSKLPAYMFSKKAIIASVDHDSDSAQVINDSGAGWVIEPENIDLLAQTMKRVYSLEMKSLNIMGDKGFEYAMNHFSKNNNLKKIVNVISKLL